MYKCMNDSALKTWLEASLT